MSMISALTKRPGEPPRHVNISNKLETLQKTVGGYVEAIKVAEDLYILCDEEGRINSKHYNCNICGYDFFGDIAIVGADGEEFADLPCKWSTLKRLFPQLWTE